jgi:hypothetical protein
MLADEAVLIGPVCILNSLLTAKFAKFSHETRIWPQLGEKRAILKTDLATEQWSQLKQNPNRAIARRAGFCEGSLDATAHGNFRLQM